MQFVYPTGTYLCANKAHLFSKVSLWKLHIWIEFQLAWSNQCPTTIVNCIIFTSPKCYYCNWYWSMRAMPAICSRFSKRPSTGRRFPFQLSTTTSLRTTSPSTSCSRTRRVEPELGTRVWRLSQSWMTTVHLCPTLGQ